MTYFIDENLNTWLKLSVPANSSVTKYVSKESGFTPSGDDVFELFDDFSGASLDTSKWNTDGTVNYSVGEVQIVGSGNVHNVLRSTQNFNASTQPVSIIAKVKHHVDVSYNGFGWNYWDSQWTSPTDSGAATITGWSTADVLCRYNNGSETNAALDLKIGSQGVFRADWKDSTSFTFTNPDGTSVDLVWGSNIDANAAFYVSDTSTSVKFSVYYVLVKKYVDTEPSVSVTDLGDFFEVVVTNNTAAELVDHQVMVDNTVLGVSAQSESLNVLDNPPLPSSGLGVTPSFKLDSYTLGDLDFDLLPESGFLMVTGGASNIGYEVADLNGEVFGGDL